MPVTDVDICNLGLGIIGASGVVSLAQPKSANETRCARFYPQRRDAELRKHRWNFAKRWQLMSTPDPTAKHPARRYGYVLPTDPWCLRIIRTAHDGGPVDWDINGRHIFTDWSPGWWLHFIGRPPTAEFDPLFVDVLAASMALVLCEPATQSGSKKDDARQAYMEAIAAAKAANGFESEPEQPQPSSWELARF